MFNSLNKLNKLIKFEIFASYFSVWKLKNLISIKRLETGMQQSVDKTSR